jgi:predicted RNase H-like HicB family nuclease
MKNTIKNAKFRFLIYQKEKEVFVGICKETGYVEEGKNADEALERLLNGTKAILEAVKENEQLTPSLNFSPPLKYKILFYWIPFWFGRVCQ